MKIDEVEVKLSRRVDDRPLAPMRRLDRMQNREKLARCAAKLHLRAGINIVGIAVTRRPSRTLPKTRNRSYRHAAIFELLKRLRKARNRVTKIGSKRNVDWFWQNGVSHAQGWGEANRSIPKKHFIGTP